MNFEAAITDYVKSHIKSLDTDYQWKISLKDIPVDIEFKDESLLNKNIYLRKVLHDNLKQATPAQRLKIITWYISVWGGVRRNAPEKLALFASATPAALISRGVKGIASWSKALSVVAPDSYAIFDARVSSSLNSIQILYKVSDPRYFPDIPSRNNTIKAAQSSAKKMYKKNWEQARNETLYSQCNALFQRIAVQIGNGVTLQMVEMVLFARAELVANDWMLEPITQSRES